MFTLLTAVTTAVVSTTPPVSGLLLAAIGLKALSRRRRDLPGRPGARQRPPLTRKGGSQHEPAAHDPAVRPLPPHLPL